MLETVEKGEEMKKIIVVVVLALLFIPNAFAKTGGSIECVGKGKLAISLEGEYVPEQRMRQDTFVLRSGGAKVQEQNTMGYQADLKLNRFAAKLKYGLFENFDLFLIAGTQREIMDYNVVFDGDIYYKFIGDDNPLVAGGFNSHLFSLGKLFDVGFSAQYLISKGKTKRIEVAAIAPGQHIDHPIDVMVSDVQYHTWFAALYFYKQFKFVTPYIGAKYQNSSYTLKGDYYLHLTTTTHSYDFKFDQDMPWILFGGVDIHINNRLDVNIEASTIGARSISGGLTWKF